MEKAHLEIQQAVNTLLNVKCMIRTKKKKQSDKRRELFNHIVNSIEQLINRQNIMYVDLQLDFSEYDEQFLEIIDALIMLHFGKEAAELISWYLWERANPDGSLNYLEDLDGNKITIENTAQLWEVLLLVNQSLDEQK